MRLNSRSIYDYVIIALSVRPVTFRKLVDYNLDLENPWKLSPRKPPNENAALKAVFNECNLILRQRRVSFSLSVNSRVVSLANATYPVIYLAVYQQRSPYELCPPCGGSREEGGGQ